MIQNHPIWYKAFIQSYIFFSKKMTPTTNQPPSTLPIPHPKKRRKKNVPKKKKQRSLTVGCRATHSKVTGWADNKFEKLLQPKPGLATRRVVKTFRRLGGTDVRVPRRDGWFFVVCWVEGFLKTKHPLKGWHEAWGILGWVFRGILISWFY